MQLQFLLNENLEGSLTLFVEDVQISSGIFWLSINNDVATAIYLIIDALAPICEAVFTGQPVLMRPRKVQAGHPS